MNRKGMSLVLTLALVVSFFAALPAPRAMAAAMPLVISEILANPSGTDSPYEYVELRATQAINFVTTPYCVVFVNNGNATTSGWVAGGSLSYGFNISSGSVNAGDIVYVGGSSMAPTGTKLRIINTGTTGGDSFGNANSAGVLGNGGANADAVGLFSSGCSSLTSATVPIDAVFFGSGMGTAVVSGGSAGYQTPVNDLYDGGKLQSTDFLGADAVSSQALIATGTYNGSTGSFSPARTWANGSPTDKASAISLVNTAATLASLDAVAAPGRVTVRWETASEADTLGFNLYRAAAAGGEWTKLNAALIPSQAPGSPFGASYRYDDASAARGTAYRYRLAAVGLAGGETPLESVQVNTPYWLWLAVGR